MHILCAGHGREAGIVGRRTEVTRAGLHGLRGVPLRLRGAGYPDGGVSGGLLPAIDRFGALCGVR